MKNNNMINKWMIAALSAFSNLPPLVKWRRLEPGEPVDIMDIFPMLDESRLCRIKPSISKTL